MFDKSTIHRPYDIGQRVVAVMFKVAEFSTLGAVVGVCLSFLGNEWVILRQTHEFDFSPSVPVPSLSSSILGSSLFLGLHANLRYQLINGMDRYAFDRVHTLPVYLAISTLTRGVTHPVSKNEHLKAMSLPAGLGQVQIPARRKTWEQKMWLKPLSNS